MWKIPDVEESKTLPIIIAAPKGKRKQKDRKYTGTHMNQ